MQSVPREIVAAMVVQAGMLMEDLSTELILSLPDDSSSINDRLETIDRSGRDLIALAAAARVLLRIAAEEAVTL